MQTAWPVATCVDGCMGAYRSINVRPGVRTDWRGCWNGELVYMYCYLLDWNSPGTHGLHRQRPMRAGDVYDVYGRI